MRRVIFCRTEPGVFRRKVRTTAYVVVTPSDVRAVRSGQPLFPTNRSSQSCPDIGPSRVANDREPGRCRHTSSPVADAIHRPHDRCRGQFCAAFRRRVTPVRHRVTFTLHGRNAKKSFDGKSLRESIPFPDLPCNVGQLAAKFPQIPAVSDAVDSLIDCMMLNTNLTTQPHHWAAAAGASSRQTPHRHDAPLPPTMDGGTR